MVTLVGMMSIDHNHRLPVYNEQPTTGRGYGI